MLNDVMNLVMRLDLHITSLADAMGLWLYFLLFLIIFCETGLVVTPFLPGDSLLFSLGSISALRPDLLNIKILGPLLVLGAVLGDGVNFFVGQYLRSRLLKAEGWRFLNKKHLAKAEEFYAKYGGKAIFLARFLPIVRTYAPFVAGAGLMERRKFTYYNVSGALCWIGLFLFAGYFFGETEVVKQNFTLVIVGIIFVSLVPVFIELGKKYWPRINFGKE